MIACLETAAVTMALISIAMAVLSLSMAVWWRR